MGVGQERKTVFKEANPPIRTKNARSELDNTNSSRSSVIDRSIIMLHSSPSCAATVSSSTRPAATASSRRVLSSSAATRRCHRTAINHPHASSSHIHTEACVSNDCVRIASISAIACWRTLSGTKKCGSMSGGGRSATVCRPMGKITGLRRWKIRKRRRR